VPRRVSRRLALSGTLIQGDVSATVSQEAVVCRECQPSYFSCPFN
jgi:hypothetical protein